MTQWIKGAEDFIFEGEKDEEEYILKTFKKRCEE